MKLEIKSRSGSVLYQGDAPDIKSLLAQAVADNVNMSGANLWGANLTEATLSGADLTGATLTEATLTEATLGKKA